ncbi:hypothetical protein Taro_024839 [Colocasia esculenta]|uniref:Uncharacterized protein n=1 Tax=Colocasia esculenta TaxID=4460 RepID=A0A843V8J9_COLES|nr:hypothetical protein [Colocasia esculenta]
MGLRQCGPQEWCWLVSTVSWLVFGGAATGPYVRGCEGEQETSHLSSSFEPHRSGAGSAPPAM